MLPIKTQSATQAIAQRDGGAPPEHRTDATEIGVIIPDVDQLAIRRVGKPHKFAAAVYLDQQFRKLIQADDAIAAQIEYFAVRLLARRRYQKRVDGVIDMTSLIDGRSVEDVLLRR